MGIGKTKAKMGSPRTKARVTRRKKEAEQLLGIPKVEGRDLGGPPAPRTWDVSQQPDVKRALLAELRLYVDSYYQIQRTRIGLGNRIGGLERDAGMPADRAAAFHDYLDLRVERIEAELRAAVGRIVEGHPLWQTWMSRVKGAGTLIAGGFLAYAGGPHYRALRDEAEAKACEREGKVVVQRSVQLGGRPGAKPWEAEEGATADDPVATGWYEVTQGFATWPTVSKFWTFCGLGLTGDGTIQRREKGVRANWSPTLKTHCWKASSVLILAGGAYADLYRQTKERLAARPPMAERLDQPDQRLLGRVLVNGEPAAGLEAGRMVTKPVLTKLRGYAPTTGSVNGQQYREVLLGWRKGHIDAQARRWLAKLFGGAVWTVMRQLENLPAPLPWIIGKEGHQTYIQPLTDRGDGVGGAT